MSMVVITMANGTRIEATLEDALRLLAALASNQDTDDLAYKELLRPREDQPLMPVPVYVPYFQSWWQPWPSLTISQSSGSSGKTSGRLEVYS